MKNLIVLGIGFALGYVFKKPEKIKEPRFVIVDEREKLSEHIFSDKAKEVLKNYIKNNKPNL